MSYKTLWLLRAQETLMKSISNVRKLKVVTSRLCQVIYLIGNTLTIFGCLALLFGVLGVFDMDRFSFGLSAGVRIIGTVAISGCLLSAIGYGVSDYLKSK